jgi:hypothetical protein
MWRRPVAPCSCGVTNRVDARYCRGCRKTVVKPQLHNARQVRPGPVSLLSLKGSFRQPPSAAEGFLYAHTRDGAVLQFATRPGAEACEIGRLALPAAGFNRGTVVDVAPHGQADPRGWTYFAATPSGVEALMLATGRNRVIYEARPGEPVAAIHGESDCQAMVGIVVSGNVAAIVVHSGADARTLMALPMREDQPAEVLLTLSGIQVAGPALCGERLAFCTERQVGMYDRGWGRAVVDFPRGFSPMLEPDTGDLSLTSCALPLVLDEAEGPSPTVWVAGRRGGRSGLLRVDFKNRDVSKFRELPQGSSLTRQQDGSTCLCTEDAIEIFGVGPSRRVEVNLRSWMPASLGGPLLVWFGYDPYPEKQRIGIGWGESRFQVDFESRDYNSETCCGAYLVGEDLAVCYLDRKAKDEQAGLKFARWCLTERA